MNIRGWIPVGVAALTWLMAATPARAQGAAAVVEKEEKAPEASGTDSAKKERDARRKRADLERDLEIARLRLRAAEQSQSAAIESGRTAIRFAERELVMAQQELDRFDKIERPRRIAEKELQLQRLQDRLDEADEELKQIEMMYAEQDLNDKTAEFVINRGRRNAERARRDIELNKQELEALVAYELPARAERLALDLDRKQSELDKARRSAEAEQLSKHIAIMEARAKVDSLTMQLADLDAGRDGVASAKAETEQ